MISLICEISKIKQMNQHNNTELQMQITNKWLPERKGEGLTRFDLRTLTHWCCTKADGERQGKN